MAAPTSPAKGAVPSWVADATSPNGRIRAQHPWTLTIAVIGSMILAFSSIFGVDAFNSTQFPELELEYGASEKDVEYVGNQKFLDMFSPSGDTRRYYLNSLAVFPGSSDTHLHGKLGVYQNGTELYRRRPKPTPITPANEEVLLKDQGFYLPLSDSLPLDRVATDVRPQACTSVQYNLNKLSDVSIIITFYNEPISTLMRSVHSVLNTSPPPLLREIILVDDYSNRTGVAPGDVLYSHLNLLPKTKLLRLPQRRGLVQGRLAGARVARAPILIVLDSHIEAPVGWLEPLLARLEESPESVVFPQIPGISSTNFGYEVSNGIGCEISFKWVMQEQSTSVTVPTRADAISSPSMAGGLFAVWADWFWELGGYDEEFSMWGAENVEMGFRIWLCGGRLECAPCSSVFHIYRHKGSGYRSPSQDIARNRLRAARLWTDQYFQISKSAINNHNVNIGSLKKMLALKKRLRCKPFQWYLDNVDHMQTIRDLSNIIRSGEIRNRADTRICIDSLSHSKENESFGLFYCHGMLGTQGFMFLNGTRQILNISHENLCLAPSFTLVRCSGGANAPHWIIEDNGLFVWSQSRKCLTFAPEPQNQLRVKMDNCNPEDKHQQWDFPLFVPEANFKLPEDEEE